MDAPAAAGIPGPLAIQALFLPRMAPADLLISADKRIGDLARLNLGGLLLRYNLIGLRLAQRLALSAAVSALATAGLTIGMTKPALAEFEIQESGVEKGEVELEYRGAVHWGFPKAEKEEAGGGRRGGRGSRSTRKRTRVRSGKATILKSNTASPIGGCSPPRSTADQPLDEDFDLSSVELELQYEMIQRKGNGLGLAFQSGYGFATRGGEADEIGFGPIVELATRQVVAHAQSRSSPPRSARTGKPTASASNMAGAPNTTSPSIGASASRCSARSRISPMPARSTTRTTASARPCSTIPASDDDEGEGGKGGDDDDKKVAEAAGDGVLVECRRSVRADRRHLGHGAEIPGLALLLRATVSQDEAVFAGTRRPLAFCLDGAGPRIAIWCQSHDDQGPRFSGRRRLPAMELQRPQFGRRASGQGGARPAQPGVGGGQRRWRASGSCSTPPPICASRSTIRRSFIPTPNEGPRNSPIKAVVLTNGDVDAIAGLLCLREGQPFTIYGTARVLDVLASNSVFDVLDARLVKRVRHGLRPAVRGRRPGGSAWA